MGDAVIPPDPLADERSVGYRYGVVLAFTATTLVFLIVAPSADWSRAVALALEGLALLVAVATSRARAEVRRLRAAAVAATLLVAGVAAGLVSAGVSTALGALVGVAVPLALVGGLIRLVERYGVT